MFTNACDDWFLIFENNVEEVEPPVGVNLISETGIPIVNEDGTKNLIKE